MTRFGTIMADPPWPYGGTAVVGNGGRGKRVDDVKIVQVGLKQHYPTMTMAALKAMPIADVAATQAHLYLWTTNAFMAEAHDLAVAWGFKPKTIVTWVKTQLADPAKPSMKTGYYFRGATEHILFAVRGSLRTMGPPEPTAFLAPREPHSVKPQMFFDLARRQSPGPYLEVFARQARPGWDRWGNEVESTVQLSGAKDEA